MGTDRAMKGLSVVVALSMLVSAAACGGGAGGSGGTQPVLEETSYSIGPSGGVVLLPDGTSVSVPKGALTHDVTLTIEANPSAPPVAGATSTGLTYLFGPEGQRFQAPVTVTLAVNPSLLPRGKSTSDVSIYTAPRGSADYLSLHTTVVDGLHVSATTTHFSNFSSGVAHLGSINPDDPMTDADMKGGQDISVAQMQSFLKSKHSALATYVDPGSHKSAAEIIVTESQKSGLSPVYMLARIQSEEGLVEDSAGWSSGELDVRLDSATGCGCPSTCSTDYRGFRAQIECAAENTSKYMADAENGGETVSGYKVHAHHTTADHCSVTPANAATAALYTYTPYEGYEYSSVYCAGAEELTAAGEDGLEVTGLAALFYKYAPSFPGSTSGSSEEVPCSGSSLGDSIAELARANKGDAACSKNSLGGRGFSTAGAWGDSCTGNTCEGTPLPEYWCADFATWVWAHSGVLHTSELGAGAASFATYGTHHHTSKQRDPAVGDAVVFDYGQHVAIVVATYKDGSIETVSGDWGATPCPDSCSCEVDFSSHSHVILNTPAYPGVVGKYSDTMTMTITAIVAPVGESRTSCKPTTGGGSGSPKPPPAQDVCCATCAGQSEAYYAAQFKNAEGVLESCSAAAVDFCQGNFSAGVSSSELGTCPVYFPSGSGGTSGGGTPSGGSCTLDGHSYPANTCTETKQCDGTSWVARSSDPSGCNTGIETAGACLTDKGAIAAKNTCTSTLQCDDGVWIDRDEDPDLCDCTLGGKSYRSNTCTETQQCNDGVWVARDSDPSSCDTGIESSGGCLTDSGSVVAKNTCTSTLQCNDGVWVERVDDPSSCR
jgi:hypothetical protein